MGNKIPVMLMILDGWGKGPENEGNAIFHANTPNLDDLFKHYPSTTLSCSGESVGLPPGVIGNSEVGHMNIGAGRVVYQDLLKINKSIEDKSFFEKPALLSAMSLVKEKNTDLHLMGLLSDGGVHSHINHLLALLDMARDQGISPSRVFVHVITDGRDTPVDMGIEYIKRLQAHIEKHEFAAIATICGRFFAMDRDKRWNRIETAFGLYTKGTGAIETDPIEAVKKAYEREETDEFIHPVIIADKDGKPLSLIKDNDGMIFFNFRADRAREITHAFIDPGFREFNRSTAPKLCCFVCMTEYEKSLKLPAVFESTIPEMIMPEILSTLCLHQIRIAETEKYAHVTYFLNGGEEEPFPLEHRSMIPSPRDVPTYDAKPEMSAFKVCDEVLFRLNYGRYDFFVVNFANMDMVGHTGVFDAAVRGSETVDICVGRIVSEIRARKGAVLITADHGNSEKMINDNGSIHTAHTLNPVPFILVDNTRKDVVLREHGLLADIAPTILQILGINKSKQMTGSTLIEG